MFKKNLLHHHHLRHHHPPVSSPCAHGMQCGDGSCVWESQWCDGEEDCPAGQDEANCGRWPQPGDQTLLLSAAWPVRSAEPDIKTCMQNLSLPSHSCPGLNVRFVLLLLVRLRGSSFLLQVYSTKGWRSVCYHGWTEQQGRSSCRQMGFSR